MANEWKILLVVVMGLFLVGTVSAWEFDNVKYYNETDRSITVKNSFLGLPLDEVAKITPLTPHINSVIRGEDRLVAEFEVDIKTLYDEGAFDDGMEFFNLDANGIEFDRPYTIKFLEDITEVETTGLKEVCEPNGFYANGTARENCWTEASTPVTTYTKVWLPIDTKEDLPKGIKTIGLFVDVLPGDYVEFIPEWFGIKMPEYAIWTESLNLNLEHYWDFNTTSVDMNDSVGSLNGSKEGTISFTTGLIGQGMDTPWTVGHGFIFPSGEAPILNKVNWTMNCWYNKDTYNDAAYIFQNWDTGQSPGMYLRYRDATGSWWFVGDGQSDGWTISDGWTPPNNVWAMITAQATNDGTGEARMWLNATAYGTTDTSVNMDAMGSFALGSSIGGGTYTDPSKPIDGTLDECSFWNRYLSPTEITQLYNEGVGMTYDADFEPIITLNFPDDLYANGLSNTSINCSADTGNDAIVNLSLIIDSEINYTIYNTTAIQNLSLEIEQNFPDGEYEWSCKGYDELGLSTQSNTRNFTVDTVSPVVSILNPLTTIDYGVLAKNQSLNYSVVEGSPDTCWFSYNDTATNNTISCTTNSSFLLGALGSRTLTLWANDTSGNVASDTVTWNYSIWEKSRTGNTTVAETATESYTIDVLSNDSLTAGNLIFNGVSYTGTQSGSNWTASIDVPTGILGVKNYYWNFTFAGSQIVTPITNVSINQTLFGICNSTLSTSYLNLSFKDEATDTAMGAFADASTWYYYLGSGAVNKTLTYSAPSTSNTNYTFCFKPEDKGVTMDVDFFKYSNTSYPQRTYSSSGLSLTNSTTQQPLYLLSTASGIYSSINIVESTGVVIEGVEVTIERQVSGLWVTIGKQTTGSDGTVTFWVNPNFPHRITAIKTGYSNAQVTITPSQSLYTLTMSATGAGSGSQNDTIEGVKWVVWPTSGSIDNISQSFNATVTASATLENCKFEILNASDITQVFATSTTLTNSSYCQPIVTYAPIYNRKIFGRLSIDTTSTDGFVIVDSDWKWSALDKNSTVTNRGIKSFFTGLTELSDFGEGNEGEFSRFILFFLITTILLGAFMYFTGVEFASPGMSLGLIWIIVLLASAGNFLTFESGSGNISDFIEQWGFSIFMTFLVVGYFINSWRRANR